MLPAHIANLNQLYPSSPPSSNPFPSSNNPFLYAHPQPETSSLPNGVGGGGGGHDMDPFSQSELDLNAALARQLEEWTNVDFSFDDGGVGIGMGIGLKSELGGGGAEGSGSGGGGGVGGGGGNGGGRDGDHGPENGELNGQGQQPQHPQEQEEDRWDTKKGKGNRFSSSRKLHERLEGSSQDNQDGGRRPHGPPEGQNASAGPSSTPHFNANAPPPTPNSTPNGFNPLSDPNFTAFLHSMYQQQLASQFRQQAQSWAAQQQLSQRIDTGGDGVPGPSSAATSGINTPLVTPSSYYPAFAIDALTGLSDPGAWTGLMAANGRMGPTPNGNANASTQRQNTQPGANVDPFAQPVVTSSTAPSPRRDSLIRHQSDPNGDSQPSSSTSANGTTPNTRPKKRPRSSNAVQAEREESTSDRSGTGDVGDDGNGGIPAGTPAGNGMVYAANGEIITHDEDKRRRNTEASARFRLKKKEREQAVEKKKQELEDRCARLERENHGLRKENTWLKALLVNGTPQPLDSPSPPLVPSRGAKQEDKKK